MRDLRPRWCYKSGSSSGMGKEDERKVDYIMENEGSVTMSTGSIIEHESFEHMMEILKEDIEAAIRYNNGQLMADTSWDLIYKGGRGVRFNEDDDVSDMKLSGIIGLINDNGMTHAFGGKGVLVHPHPDSDPPIWVADIAKDYPEETARVRERIRRNRSSKKK